MNTSAHLLLNLTAAAHRNQSIKGKDKRMRREVHTTGFHNVCFGQNSLIWLQAVLAAVNKQKKF